MDVRHLKAFVGVAEALNFTRAAERLFLAQQALSTQIRQLEGEVGASLFVRTTRKVELTAAGEAFLPRVTSILAAMDEAKDVARKVGMGEDGELRLGWTHSLGIESLPLIMDSVHQKAPRLRVSSAVTLADQALSGVARGQFDLGIVRSPELLPGLKSVVIRQEPLGVILSVGHSAANKESVCPEDLSASTLVIWPRWHSPGFADRVLATFATHREAGRVLVYETFTQDGFLADKRSLIEMREGRAFQTAFRTQYQPVPEGYVWRPLTPSVPISVELVYRDGVLTEPQQRFIEIARLAAQENGWLDSPSEREELEPTPVA